MLLENILLYLHPQGHCSSEAFTKIPPQKYNHNKLSSPTTSWRDTAKIPGLGKTSMEQQ